MSTRILLNNSSTNNESLSLHDDFTNDIAVPIDTMTGCGDCFAKYSCSGDCLAKVLASTGSLHGNDSGGFRCETNRTLIREDLYEMLSKNAGVEQ